MPARLTHADAAAYVARCEAALAAPPAGGASASPVVYVLDAAALGQFDSAVLAVLLAVRRRVLVRGGSLRVPSLPPRLRSLAALYGVEALLPA